MQDENEIKIANRETQNGQKGLLYWLTNSLFREIFTIILLFVSIGGVTKLVLEAFSFTTAQSSLGSIITAIVLFLPCLIYYYHRNRQENLPSNTNRFLTKEEKLAIKVLLVFMSFAIVPTMLVDYRGGFSG